MRPKQNGRHIADEIFKLIFFNENRGIFIKILLKFVPKDPIIDMPMLSKVMMA